MVAARRRSSQSPRGVQPIRTTASSHEGQRRMAPSSMAYRRSSPIGIILAQPAQVICAAVEREDLAQQTARGVAVEHGAHLLATHLTLLLSLRSARS
jgi:hypothetical protein